MPLSPMTMISVFSQIELIKFVDNPSDHLVHVGHHVREIAAIIHFEGTIDYPVKCRACHNIKIIVEILRFGIGRGGVLIVNQQHRVIEKRGLSLFFR